MVASDHCQTGQVAKSPGRARSFAVRRPGQSIDEKIELSLNVSSMESRPGEGIAEVAVLAA